MSQLAPLLTVLALVQVIHADVTPLSNEETERVITGATAFQSQQSALTASFTLSVQRQAGTRMNGQMVWMRMGNRERLSIRWDNDGSSPGDPFLDRDLFRDGDKFVARYLPNSVLISDGPIPFYPTPADLLSVGVRKTLRELVEEGASVTGVREGEEITLTIVRPQIGPSGTTITATLREDLDYCITEWSCPGCARSAKLEWRRADDGTVQPVAIEYKANDQLPNWTLTVDDWAYVTPPVNEITFQVEPGMLIKDILEADANGRPSIYTIDSTGGRQDVVLLKHRKTKPASQPAILGGTLGIIGMAVGLRLWLARRA